MQTNREYWIDFDDGDYELVLMEGGVQVGGAVFPDDGTGGGYALAEELGRVFGNKSKRDTLH